MLRLVKKLLTLAKFMDYIGTVEESPLFDEQDMETLRSIYRNNPCVKKMILTFERQVYEQSIRNASTPYAQGFSAGILSTVFLLRQFFVGNSESGSLQDVKNNTAQSSADVKRFTWK